MFSNQPTLKEFPSEFENMKSDKQSFVTLPSNWTKVPSPDGITVPEKEKARTVVEFREKVKPFSAASPP